MTPKYRCTKCGYVGEDQDWATECIYWGSAYEPAEYEAYCPRCNANWDWSEEVEDELATG
jgi:rubredoxin